MGALRIRGGAQVAAVAAIRPRDFKISIRGTAAEVELGVLTGRVLAEAEAAAAGDSRRTDSNGRGMTRLTDFESRAAHKVAAASCTDKAGSDDRAHAKLAHIIEKQNTWFHQT
jgi:hypothetical protein